MNVLLSKFRTRILDQNGEPFSQAARLAFFDANTTTPKDVYVDVNGTISYGAIVDLNSEGYVPVEGVWLGSGAYSISVETYVYTDPILGDQYNTEWTMPYIVGADEEGTQGELLLYPTVQAMINSTSQGDSICLGYYEPNDHGGGVFHWDDSSTNQQDLGAILENTNVTIGRYFRQWDAVEYNIAQWGVSTSVVNNKLFFDRATGYATQNDVQIRCLSGTYKIANETLSLPSSCVIDEGFVIENNDNVAFLNCDIRSRSNLATNTELLFVNNEKIYPQWWDNGLLADIVFNYVNEQSFKHVVIDKAWVLSSDDSSVGLPFEFDITEFIEDGYISISDSRSSNVKLGGIISNGNKYFIQGNFTNLKTDGYKSSYFDSLTSVGISQLTADQGVGMSFIFDEDFTFDTAHYDVSQVTYSFENDAKIKLNAQCKFNQIEWDLNNFSELYDITQLISKSYIITNDKNILTQYGSNLIFQAQTITFKNLYFKSQLDHDWYGNDMKFVECFIDGKDFRVGATKLLVKGCNFPEASLTILARGTVVYPFVVKENILSCDASGSEGGIITIDGDGAVNVRVLNGKIVDNSFTGIIPGLTYQERQRIKSSGDFSFDNPTNPSASDEPWHILDIRDNSIRDNDFSDYGAMNFAATTRNNSVNWRDAAAIADEFWVNSSGHQQIELGSNTQAWRIGLFVLNSDTTSNVNIDIPYTVGATFNADGTTRTTTAMNCYVDILPSFTDFGADRWTRGTLRIKDIDEDLQVVRLPVVGADGTQDSNAISLKFRTSIYEG